jgi:D-3-phosphoglycerate dehydrogenase / 2-oxoglutarate reductase
VHILGIRSKTRVTAAALAKIAEEKEEEEEEEEEGGVDGTSGAGVWAEHRTKRRLLAVGCFCIGTDQVDLPAAARAGVPVFNAPFSNTRSVAELVLGEIIALSRALADKSADLHRGHWSKSAAGCFEVRGKTLGIVGYGHIGSQLSVIAEALGMIVLYHDVVSVLPIGRATAADSLEHLLETSDFVSLHVPRSPATANMIAAPQLARMKKGAKLINASRGTVVDVQALADALKAGHIGGAAVDVFPSEPAKNGPGFESPLRGLKNVILSPHIGGSTAEAQINIGREVAAALINFM